MARPRKPIHTPTREELDTALAACAGLPDDLRWFARRQAKAQHAAAVKLAQRVASVRAANRRSRAAYVARKKLTLSA